VTSSSVEANGRRIRRHYLVAYFRCSLGLGRTRSRAAAAVVLLAVPVGASVSAAAGLALTTALFGGSLMLEARTARTS